MELGEGQYSIAVIRLSDTSADVNFNVDYAWSQKKEKKEGDMLASATQSAVLASIIDAPLLFAEKNNLPSSTKTALDTLGVKKVYLVDLGGHSKVNIKKALQSSRSRSNEVEANVEILPSTMSPGFEYQSTPLT